jgi:excisionase family DNA binding protein
MTDTGAEPAIRDALEGAASAPPILTTAMAAELLHVHVEYLRRMVREGRVPAHRFPGGREIRFLRDELIDWVRAQPGEDRSPSLSERRDEQSRT